jgi:hypothetical protein
MHWNSTNIIAVTNKMKALIGKLGLSVRNLESKILNMFSVLKGFVEENSVKTSDTGINQCIKDHLVTLQSRFYTYEYFPEAGQMDHTPILC